MRFHQRFADQYRVRPELTQTLDVLSIFDAAFGDEKDILRDQLSEPCAVIGINRKILQVAVVDADDPRAGADRRVDLLLIMCLYQRRQSEFVTDSDVFIL